MVETDWREILSFSQRELGEADKEKLCEGISWMEADDIELNFSDLKILFRLAQDILKYKSEQVNNLLGQLDTTSRKSGKRKYKSQQGIESASTEKVLETIAHQEEVIKANKEILEQLYTDIAELEGKKKHLADGSSKKEDSDSSRDALSEMNAVVQLENEVAMKNRHIRKLLTNVKVLEEENTKFKQKTSVLKDKLTEAAQLIDNLTEQLLLLNNESSHLKEILGKSEQAKVKLTCEIEALRKEFFEKDSTRENIFVEIKTKVQHWKNLARITKSELEALSIEHEKLKENITRSPKTSSPKVKNNNEEQTIKELQDKLTEASNEIEQSANLINLLRAENSQLKCMLEEAQDNDVSENKNESDEGKERNLISKLRKKVKNLSDNLLEAEEIIFFREKELAEVASELQLVQSNEGIKTLLDGLKHKKQELKYKNEGIKSMVEEINKYSQEVNNLQLENETLRQKYDIPTREIINTEGIIKKYRDLENSTSQMCKDVRRLENELINFELTNRQMHITNIKLRGLLNSKGCTQYEIDTVLQDSESDENIQKEDGKAFNTKQVSKEEQKKETTSEAEIKAVMEENEGLRIGLQEILGFLKDNSTTSSGILTLECPSLEALLRSMEARHTAGWFAPHMSTILELRAAIGGKDALLKALHEARKETYNVLSQLSKETQKSTELERKLHDLENEESNDQSNYNYILNETNMEFGSWIADKDQNIDINDENQVTEMIAKGNSLYESQLKKGLEYFHQKYKQLYSKITYMAVQAADDQNKWAIREEKYKAQIENLKGRVEQQEDEDFSENSPGLINIPNPSSNPSNLQRKCKFLEESYKYIRTLNENIKNENMEAKKEIMTLSSEYESEIQRLILSIANLTDKLRNSIPIEMFWNLNAFLNENIIKLRKLIDGKLQNKSELPDLFSRLEKDRLEIVSDFNQGGGNGVVLAKKGNNSSEHLLLNVEESVLKKQLQELCLELNSKNKETEFLENQNTKLQEVQSQLIDNTLASLTKHDIDILKSQLQNLGDENKVLKEKSQQVGNQLEIALLQIQENQQRQMSNDMEVNLLRHQILDLQSTSDNKAIVARLSGEVLVAHLQVTESNKKIERLNSALNKEKDLRVEAEEMLRARQKIFDVYSFRYESKFRYMFEVMQIFRQQYLGSIPLTSIENYLNKLEDVTRESQVVNEKLQEIEDLRSNFMTKHSVFDQILDVSRNKCIIEGDSCPHKIKSMMMKSTKIREMDHLNKKVKILEQSRNELAKRYHQLEKTLVLVNQGFENSKRNAVVDRKHSDGEIVVSNLELDDVQSDDESESRKSKTISIPIPLVLKPLKATINNVNNKTNELNTLNASVKTAGETNKNIEVKPILTNVLVQTMSYEQETKQAAAQTVEDNSVKDLKQMVQDLNMTIEKQRKELAEAMFLIQERTKEILVLKSEKNTIEASIQTLKLNNNSKDKLNEKLQTDINGIRNELDQFKALQISENNKKWIAASDENKSIVSALKQSENDKKVIVAEYKELLNNEREEYSKTIKELNVKNMDLQSKLDRKGSDTNSINNESLKEVVGKYTLKIVELEDKCFKLQSELDECKTQIKTYQSEVDRWKGLAGERLVKMEQVNDQLSERHFQEVESYKAENQHWLSQLNDTQREHIELRSRLTEQKALYVKQLAEKDGQLEQMRSVVNNLRGQVMNMQTMISVNDPSFDLSAIVEVEETSDALSNHGSDRLEIKFDCSGDVNEINDEFGRIGHSSTAIWQEPVIERLRRDKQMTSKQNALLRRQIKALASRERRTRLDAQNLRNQVFRIGEPSALTCRLSSVFWLLRRQVKTLASRERRTRLDTQNLRNQVFRISTSGSKVATAETAALHNKIASLQAQLTTARRDTNSSIALWDKWKRAQQATERLQTRFDEKCQEVKKLEHCLNMSKSAIGRLDREKRVLLSRLTQEKHENQLSLEKQDNEVAEKTNRPAECSKCMNAPPLSNHALLERVQAQQRRIAALEVAEKGNELLVSEYERSLAEITSLKSQVLKLESSLLESQIRTPVKENKDSQPEVDYWKNYCEMLKDENVQMHQRMNTMEATPVSASQHKINDMEQTILMLRGLVSKLQVDQKSSAHKKPDSRPSSGLSGGTEKSRGQLEPGRVEIANLKRSIQEKDLLLERSKEMLKIAAEREDDLLRENAFLRRQLEELTNPKQGFLSA